MFQERYGGVQALQHGGQVGLQHADEHANVRGLGDVEHNRQQTLNVRVVHFPALARGSGHEHALDAGRQVLPVPPQARFVELACGGEMGERRTPQARHASWEETLREL
jgi:hypothetical protein